MKKKKVVLIGGAGYVGSQLTLDFLFLGCKVIVVDNFTFGNPFPFINSELTLLNKDIRDVSSFESYLKDADTIIHLACVSNDPSFDLDPDYGKSVNLDCFPKLIKVIKDYEVERFIYASSSSVYGIKDEDKVDETLSLEPLTDYSKFKVECEKILLDTNLGDTCKTILRPATVCGPSLRQRLDVVVNIFATNAYFNGKLTVLGGEQLRPNIHIKDMSRAYTHISFSDKKLISDQIYNVGFENKSVAELANLAVKAVGNHVEVEIQETNDPRSYKINSDKITKQTGFLPEFSISEGLGDLITAFKLGHCNDAINNPLYKNIEVLKRKGLGK